VKPNVNSIDWTTCKRIGYAASLWSVNGKGLLMRGMRLRCKRGTTMRTSGAADRQKQDLRGSGGPPAANDRLDDCR